MIPYNVLENCILCPRRCGVNRLSGQKGYCGASDKIRVARAALHMWEEPCISGTDPGNKSGLRGSGAVFFSHCNLGCIFCQNREISHDGSGEVITAERLSQIFSELQEKGAANINLVTALHYLPMVSEALKGLFALGKGIRKPGTDSRLQIPVAYNCGGYESAEIIAMAEDMIDIYMPDFKYMDGELAGRLSKAPDYPEAAKAATDEMVRQHPQPVFDENGLMKEGVLIRHLVLPGHTRQAIEILGYLAERYGDGVYISLLRQYTPMPGADGAPSRRLTDREYDKVVNAAIDLGLKNVYIQEKDSARSIYIPAWDGEGVLLQ